MKIKSHEELINFSNISKIDEAFEVSQVCRFETLKGDIVYSGTLKKDGNDICFFYQQNNKIIPYQVKDHQVFDRFFSDDSLPVGSYRVNDFHSLVSSLLDSHLNELELIKSRKLIRLNVS